ncbi:DUF2607 family protein [Vibrio sp. 10N.286.49.B1]|uniref:DUF2607 family protein n=1 Tax=unclassified Vibrio TaxID=2614977 RepID=UPI000C857A02|nr:MULTISPECIES: DUF2607 family protein [unclassified Vibrio]
MPHTPATTSSTHLYYALALSLLLLSINFISIDHRYDFHGDHQHHHCALYAKGTHSLPIVDLKVSPIVTYTVSTIVLNHGIDNTLPLSVSARSPPSTL